MELSGAAGSPFAGGGEAGRAMARLDRAATPLGPAASWPAALHDAVRVLLAAPVPMWLGWGPELTVLHNDAFPADALRPGRSRALGRPARTVWAQAWDRVGPLLASVRATGTAATLQDLPLLMHRGGRVTETFWTLSCGPPAGDAGAADVPGVLCVATETTGPVLAQRRGATLQALASDLLDARTAADVLAAASRRIGANPHDLPFAQVHLFDGSTSRPAADGWPAEVLGCTTTTLVDDLAARFGTVPTGPWARPPDAAAAVPLDGPDGRQAGVVLVGLSPVRPFDEAYRGFVEALAAQVAAGLAAVAGRAGGSGSGRARGPGAGEQERERVLAAVGAALDRETRLAARRTALVRALVAERIADVARLVAVDPEPRLVATATTDQATDRLVARVEPDWAMVRTVLETGEAVRTRADETYLTTRFADRQQRELRRRLDLGEVTFVPLVTRGRTVGVLAVARNRPAPEPDAGDLALLVEIGRRAATALDNAQLYEREQETNRRMTLLQRATAALSAAATPQQVAAVAVAQFRALLGAPAVGLWERHPATLEAVVLRGWSDDVTRDWRSLPVSEGLITSQALDRGEAVWVADTRRWTGRGLGRAAVAAEYGYRGFAALPLVAGGRCVGLVGVGFPRPHEYDTSTRISAVALAHQCAQAFQRASLLAAESAARQAAEEFGAVVSALSGATTPAEVTEVILDHAARLGAVDAAVLLRSGDLLEVAGRRGGPAEPDRRLDLLAAHPIAHAVRSGESVWHDVRSGPAWTVGRFSAAGTDLPAQVVLPLGVGRTAVGALGMRFADPPVFSADERATVHTIVGQCAQALDRARMHQAEHEVAEVLQRSLLPPELPVLERLGSAARYLPGAAGLQTGGDWYDLLPLAGGRAALVVGDVVGQGPRAAAVMGQLRSALAGYLMEGHGPAAALELLDAFAGRVPGARGSTCACLIVDWTAGELRWARAGHPPVLLVDPSGARLLDDGGGTVLVVSGRPPYREARAAVAPGASVVLYTDGLVERRGEVPDDGLRRLVDAATGAHGIGADALVDRLLAASGLDRHSSDDVAVVAARLLPAPLRGRRPAMPASLAALRQEVRAWASEAALDGETLDDLQLALGEACANAVEHAYPGGGAGGAPEFEYELRLRPDGGVDARVRDFGTWRPPPADRGYRGRGVAIVQRLAVSAEVSPAADGTTVRFTIAPPPLDEVPAAPAAADRGPRPQGTVLADRPAAADGPLLVEISGEVDLPAADMLRSRLLARVEAAAARPEPALVIDLDGVGYLASAGLGVLLEVAAQARDRGVALHLRAREGGVAARVLALSGVADAVGAAASGAAGSG